MKIAAILLALFCIPFFICLNILDLTAKILTTKRTQDI
jgi:hypothetical protein